MMGGGDTTQLTKDRSLSGDRRMKTDAEVDLVLAAKQNIAAFEPLYRLYVDPIFRYCYRRLGAPEPAADASRQVFIKAMSSIATCRETSFRSWLFAIAHNVLVDHFRTRRDEWPIDDATTIVDRSPSPEDETIAAEQRSEIVRLLDHLTPDQRQVVELRLAGLDGNEIAAILGRSRGSVDTAQSRAVSRLREVLGKSRPEPQAGKEDRHATA
jgi:RNA polymerase sigma-70 factor (ECF subfamily)